MLPQRALVNELVSTVGRTGPDTQLVSPSCLLNEKCEFGQPGWRDRSFGVGLGKGRECPKEKRGRLKERVWRALETVVPVSWFTLDAEETSRLGFALSSRARQVWWPCTLASNPRKRNHMKPWSPDTTCLGDKTVNTLKRGLSIHGPDPRLTLLLSHPPGTQQGYIKCFPN